MKETFKRIKADMILSAVLCAVMGIVIFVWPDKTIDVLCKILAVGLILIGVVNLISYFTNRSIHPFAGPLGLIILLVGFWIFMKPESIVSLVPIVIGVLLVIHGVQDIKVAIESKDNGYERWWSMLIVGSVSLIFGVICIVNAFGLVKLALRFVGIALIYDGASDLWVVWKAVRMAKAAKEEADALDIEYKEADD